MKLRSQLIAPLFVVALGLCSAGAALAGGTTQPTQQVAATAGPPRFPGGFKHLVVIYEENHSFDNLYGHWGSVDGEAVDGTDDAPWARTTQVAQDGTPYSCLLQVDVNLTSPSPLPTTCRDTHAVYNPDGTVKSTGFESHFANQPFPIDDVIAPTDATCPVKPLYKSSPTGSFLKGTGDPGGCTADLVHRYYQEQYQLNSGAQNRYVTGSDAVGLSMGYYRTRNLPIYSYLHGHGAPNYVIADHFFQAALGGSFLNHQWLIAARTPLDTSHGTTGVTKNSVLDGNGMVATYPLYRPTSPVVDGALTRACADPATDDYATACGDYAVNTVQPFSDPWNHNPNAGRIPLLDYPTIGDRMSEAGVSWNWYAGGWDAAAAGTPGPLFQYHHQPFNYFAAYAPGQPGRSHLQDESRFLDAARSGSLPTVSFVKPYGLENEHPGYASEPGGSDHLVDLVRAVEEGPQAGNTLIVVTYDEFGGQWDHVPPPGQGSATSGVHDVWGPGTRVPAMLIGRRLTTSGVDHTVYDTTSILATIERSLHLAPLTTRDASVNDLSAAVAAGRHR